MGMVNLTKKEKEFLKLLDKYGSSCTNDYPPDVLSSVVRSLDAKGLVRGAFAEGGDVEDVRLTTIGKSYLVDNPKLRNPFNWPLFWTGVAAAASVCALLFSILTFLLACKR